MVAHAAFQEPLTISDQRLAGQRVLITQADVFVGPVLCDVFARHGATVIASTDPLVHPDAPAAAVAAAGLIDILLSRNSFQVIDFP